jgi:hypothetical protein
MPARPTSSCHEQLRFSGLRPLLGAGEQSDSHTRGLQAAATVVTNQNATYRSLCPAALLRTLI